MDTRQHPLKADDMIAPDELDVFFETHVTDEMARRLGYPSAKVFFMERELSQLAAQWHQSPDDATLKAYHLLYYKMLAFGFTPDDFDASTEIPAAYMPELPDRMAES